MNIVILRTNTGDFGKIGSYNVQEVGLANSFIKMGHSVSVLFLHKNVLNISKDEFYNFVYYLPHRTFLMHGIFDTNLLEQFHPDLVLHFSDNQLWAKNVIYWCKKRDIKCIQYFGNVLSDNPCWVNQLYTKVILYRNRKSYNYSINIAKTEKVKDELLKHNIPFHKIINVGLDGELLNHNRNRDNKMRVSVGINDDEIVLLFIGRLVDYKKPVLACKILQSLQEKGIKSRLIIIGKGELEDTLNKYIDENKLGKSILWKKNVPYNEIYRYMLSSDVFLNLSPKEIFGMAILEAMYYGLPVVANYAPGPNVIIENQISGYLCDFGDDVDKWANIVLKAYNERFMIASNSHKRIKAKFMWDSLAEEFLID